MADAVVQTKMSGVQCNKCGSTNIDDTTNVVCLACGNVLEEGAIISDVQYVQDSHGVNRAVGQLIRNEDGMPNGLGQGFGRQSQALTIQNARRNIQQLASKISLNPTDAETAVGYYKLALAKNLTKGRKTTHVIAACVYMVCRKNGTSHMLLDFSDALHINVYELGKTYLKLSNELHINTPVLDPVLYIARFAHQLQFGKKEHEVVVTATKLLRRMKSDWIHFGRRPSGLCGAALLVAARMHNFNRTIEDIIKIVKVCHATVRKRLNEFGETPSGRLSIQDFLTVDLSEKEDPPSFKNARKKMRELEDEDKLKELTSQVTEFQKQIEKLLENTRKKSKYAKYAEIDGDDLSSSPKCVNTLIAENTINSIKDVIGNDDSFLSEADNLVPILEEENQSISYNIMRTEPDCSLTEKVPEVTNTDLGNELDLTGVDDAELDKYFMKPCEYKRKDEVWHKFNADYLEEMKEKEERRALEEEEKRKKPLKGWNYQLTLFCHKNKRCFKKRDRIQANTPGEAMSMVFQQKKISHKLNYDILRSLNPDNTLDDLVEPEPPETESKASSNPPSVKSVRVRTKPKPTFTPVPLNIKQGMSDIIGRNRQRTMVENTKDDEEDSIFQEQPTNKRKISEVIVEDSEEKAVSLDDMVSNLAEVDDGEEEVEEEYDGENDLEEEDFNYDKIVEDEMGYY
ncbi:transcription factor IIIB 90 kDa subunit [Caerostris extrusa]|uniref:B-related factor 1 n=1 Tax=Caerostris extrusa TaxID=172846 RepID=A0AAV4Q2W0_CAEEX|nr:transcription factor IIIB 90 kDa subunit [Caerostris extrusa]